VRGILVRVSIVGILVTAFFALTLPAMASSVATATTSATSATSAPSSSTVQLTKDEQQLVDLINAARAKKGLKPVVVHAKLVASARGHSAEMATKKYFSHSSYNGEYFAKRIIRYGYAKTGYRYWLAGENIYWGSNIYSSPVAVMDTWMASSAHRAIILDPKFRDIGVGTGSCSSFSGQSNVTFYTLDVGRRY
jgi:uncharacterized protein YkwD